MKAPRGIGYYGRTTLELSLGHHVLFKTLPHLFIPNFVINPHYCTQTVHVINKMKDVIQMLPPIQYFFTYLNGKLNTYKNENHFKYSKKK